MTAQPPAAAARQEQPSCTLDANLAYVLPSTQAAEQQLLAWLLSIVLSIVLTVCIPTPPSSLVRTARRYFEKNVRYCWNISGGTEKRTSIMERLVTGVLNSPSGNSLGAVVLVGGATVTLRNTTRLIVRLKP